jgi:hypothetical protein
MFGARLDFHFRFCNVGCADIWHLLGVNSDDTLSLVILRKYMLDVRSRLNLDP